MEIALVEYFPNHGFEVWITDRIEIGEGMGDVFDNRADALKYAKDHDLPIVDISYNDMPDLKGEELRTFLRQYLKIAPDGEVISISNDMA